MPGNSGALLSNVRAAGGLAATGLLDTPALLYSMLAGRFAAHDTPYEMPTPAGGMEYGGPAAYWDRVEMARQDFPLQAETGAAYGAAQNFARAQGWGPIAQMVGEAVVPGPGPGEAKAAGALAQSAPDAIGALKAGIAGMFLPQPARMAAKAPLKHELDPYGFSNVKLDRPFDMVSVEADDLGALAPRQTISLEDLEGSVAIPLVGDRSALGGLVRRIDDVELANPVMTEGGPDFMRGPAAQADDAVWASQEGVIKRLSNDVKRLQDETGRDVIGVYSAMSPKGVDYASFTARSLAEMIPSASISNAAKADFDDFMRTQKMGQLKAFPEWPGIDAPNLGEWIEKNDRNIGKKFVQMLDKARWQDLGFPSAGKVRKAVTNPDLYSAELGDAGYAIARLTPDVIKRGEQSVPHTTYMDQIKGEYLGGLSQPLRAEELFRDWSQELMSRRGMPFDSYELTRTQPAQVIDEELIEQILKNR